MLLDISSFCVLATEIIRHALMMLQVNNKLNFFTTQVVVLLLFILLTILSTRYLSKMISASEQINKRILIYLFIGYFIIQALQYSYVYFVGRYIIEVYFEDEFFSYGNFLNSTSSLGFYTMFFGIFKTLAVGLLFLFSKRLLFKGFLYQQWLGV